jgi:hypothetical protein
MYIVCHYKWINFLDPLRKTCPVVSSSSCSSYLSFLCGFFFLRVYGFFSHHFFTISYLFLPPPLQHCPPHHLSPPVPQCPSNSNSHWPQISQYILNPNLDCVVATSVDTKLLSTMKRCLYHHLTRFLTSTTTSPGLPSPLRHRSETELAIDFINLTRKEVKLHSVPILYVLFGFMTKSHQIIFLRNKSH